MSARSWLAVLVVASTSLALGCGGADGAPGSSELAVTGAGGSGGGGGPVYEIRIEEFRFAPENLVVPPGATVTVVNLDDMPHSVTSRSEPGVLVPGEVDGISFDTGAFGPGERTFTIPPTAAPGTVVPYFCTVHPAGMANDGRITVR